MPTPRELREHPRWIDSVGDLHVILEVDEAQGAALTVYKAKGEVTWEEPNWRSFNGVLADAVPYVEPVKPPAFHRYIVVDRNGQSDGSPVDLGDAYFSAFDWHYEVGVDDEGTPYITCIKEPA